MKKSKNDTERIKGTFEEGKILENGFIISNKT